MTRTDQYIDITVGVKDGIPTWPGSPGFSRSWTQTIQASGDANVSLVQIESHTGTHIDAPLHFVKNGTTVDQIPLEVLVGEAQVIEITGVNGISALHLKEAGVLPGTKRLLIKTDNNSYWENELHPFKEDFAALTSDAAQWLVDHGIELVGIDYLSIQLYNDSPDTHLILLNAGIIILETINLSKVDPGTYELFCMPLLIAGAEAAPTGLF